MLVQCLQMKMLSIMALASDLVTLWPIFLWILKGVSMMTTCSGLCPVLMVSCGCALRVTSQRLDTSV